MNEKRMLKELRRLLNLPIPPNGEEAQRIRLAEYVRILKGQINSVEHLIAIVDHLMSTANYCPTPSQLSEAVESVRPPDKAKAPMGCEACQGSGYVGLTHRVNIDGRYAYDQTSARPCSCALGQFIQPEYDKRKNVTPGRSQDLG